MRHLFFVCFSFFVQFNSIQTSARVDDRKRIVFTLNDTCKQLVCVEFFLSRKSSLKLADDANAVTHVLTSNKGEKMTFKAFHVSCNSLISFREEITSHSIGKDVLIRG